MIIIFIYNKKGDLMSHVLLHTLLDTLKTIPILFVVYLFIEWLEHRVDFVKFMNGKGSRFGPLMGALVGCIPQCGFSAASASLYSGGMIGGATLIAVFLSTSDEAIPVMLSNLSDMSLVIWLIAVKLIIAVAAGYLLKYTLFRSETLRIRTLGQHDHDHDHEHTGGQCGCCTHHGSIFKSAAVHTLKITAFLAVTMLIINLAVHFIGEDNLSTVLLSGSVFQPILTALIGLIPGCATSVLLTQLLINGSISFGAAIAGLSAGTGFGYLVLFKECRSKKSAFKIILCTYLVSVVAGMIIHLAML